MFIWTAVISLIISILVFPVIKSFLILHGIEKQNFEGTKIPNATGVLISISLLITSSIIIVTPDVFGDLRNFKDPLMHIFILTFAASFAGFIDDIFSIDEIRGFKSHLGELLKGRVTTGMLKAILGLAVALIIAAFTQDNLAGIVSAMFVIGLSMNAFNLLDIRPGRALKIYILMMVVLILTPVALNMVIFPAYWHLVGAVISPALILLYDDLSKKSMIGDTGANVLGAIVGYAVISTFTGNIRLVILALLLIFNFVADRWSITKMIESQPLLNKLDRLGRK